MFKEQITAQDAVDLLNDAVAKDRAAITALVNNRVETNEALADHPTIQVSMYQPGNYRVGLLGIINGMFGADDEGWGQIAAVQDVVCPGKCSSKGFAEYRIGDPCPVCGRNLVAGPVIKFVVLDRG